MATCTFIGHHDCSNEVIEELYKRIEYLIINKNVDTFYIGNNGNFDYYVYKVLCKLEKLYNIEIIILLAYINRKKDDVYYDYNKTVFPDILEKVPLKFAIHKRNEYMKKHSQYMICYMNHTFSNTYQFVKKAKNRNVEIHNIGSVKLGDI